MASISLKYTPYNWQKLFHHGVVGKRFAVLISSRQIGKTELAVAELCYRALEKKANYAYVAPFSIQGRKIFWPRLKKILQPISHLCEFRETDLICTLPNGSIIYAITGENESCRGLSLAGMVVDEFDSIRTDVWQNAILPTLASHPDHFIIFIGTLSGSGKLIKLYNSRQKDKDWYCSMVNAVDSKVFSEDQLARFQIEMDESAYAREFMCDPHPPVSNSVIGKQILEAERSGRVFKMPQNPVATVQTAWDLGFRDATAIWIFQLVGAHIHILAYEEFAGISLTDICHRLVKKYHNFGIAVLPHDGANTDYTLGMTRQQTIEDMLNCRADILPKVNPAEGLAFTRLNLPRCLFSEDKCSKGLQYLKQARYVVDQKTGTITDKVIHDDASHPLDAFRYMCTWIEREYPTNSTTGTQAFKRRTRIPKVKRCMG